jgi:cell division cycle 20-like protein 1 (cofactor of APC complex)
MGANEEAYNSMITIAPITNAANALNTPPVATPPRISTPPLGGTERRKSDKRALEATSMRGEAERASGSTFAEALDPNALSKALLKEFEDGGRPRETTPGGSPSRKRQRVYGDR